jgi:hypothetical protein
MLVLHKSLEPTYESQHSSFPYMPHVRWSEIPPPSPDFPRRRRERPDGGTGGYGSVETPSSFPRFLVHPPFPCGLNMAAVLRSGEEAQCGLMVASSSGELPRWRRTPPPGRIRQRGRGRASRHGADWSAASSSQRRPPPSSVACDLLLHQV